LPFKKMPFNFTQRIKIDPLLMAPEVQEGGSTPLTDREYIVEKFVCTPYKIGGLITEQQIEHGIADAVTDITQELVDSVNLSITYDNIMRLQGVGAPTTRALARLNLAIAGKPHGVGSAVAWSDPTSDIIKDILAMKTNIKKRSGAKAVAMYVPTDEYEYIMKNNGIKEELKYVRPDFLTNGEIAMVKGVKIYEVDTFYKDRVKKDEKIPILEHKAIMVAEDVGYTAYASASSAPILDRWEDKDRRAVVVQARSNSVSVIKDYGKIGIISGTSS
jgi:hypothetical protein